LQCLDDGIDALRNGLGWILSYWVHVSCPGVQGSGGIPVICSRQTMERRRMVSGMHAGIVHCQSLGRCGSIQPSSTYRLTSALVSR
jgi:hypothetical protein